jgi:hypothetical protein
MTFDKNSFSDYGKDGLNGWKKIADLLQDLILADNASPKIQSFYEDGKIKGQVSSKDVSKR